MNAPLKEGKTPTEFLTSWSNAFSECAQKEKNGDLRVKFDQLMRTCDEALKHMHGLFPQEWRDSEVIEGLNTFIDYFQKGVIDAGGNAWAAQRRINMIRDAIRAIESKKPKVKVVQASLF